MDIELLPISEYRDIFKVYALFKYDNRKTYRMFADIVRNGHEEDVIDAYIIMINPGSCHKISDNNPLKNTKFYKGFDMVEAISDPAQKCVMSLMEACNMNKIRILNLFDYANGNLEEAIKQRGKSIFSVERATERARYMPTDAVCIASWGLNPKLLDYKRLAYESIGADHIIGYAKNKEKYEYRYIKPRGEEQQKLVISNIRKEYFSYINKLVRKKSGFE